MTEYIEDLPDVETEWETVFSVPFTVKAYDKDEAEDKAWAEFQRWMLQQLEINLDWFKSFDLEIKQI